MTNQQVASAKLVLGHRSANRYLKRCRHCGLPIYLKEGYDGVWRPYESWVAGSVSENEWRRHQCVAVTVAATIG